MKMYDCEGARNPARIRILLADKGLEHEVEFVSADLFAAEQKQDAFPPMNPKRRYSGHNVLWKQLALSGDGPRGYDRPATD